MSSNATPELELAAVQPSELHSLEEKIYRAIESLKAAREAKAAAERDLVRVREQLEQREEEIDILKQELSGARRKRDEESDALRAELVSLRKEREDVRARVEKILKQIDQLTELETQA